VIVKMMSGLVGVEMVWRRGVTMLLAMMGGVMFVRRILGVLGLLVLRREVLVGGRLGRCGNGIGNGAHEDDEMKLDETM